jgi:hypothetical protein
MSMIASSGLIAAMNINESDQEVTEECFKKLLGSLDKLAASSDPDVIDQFRQIGDEITRLKIINRSKDADEFKQQRTMKSQLLLRSFGLVNSRIDPTFDADKDVPAINVAPPAPNSRAGVDPRSIKDPKARREYRQAIRENNEKAQRYRLQAGLRKLREGRLKEIFVFTKLQFDVQDKDDGRVLDSLIKEEVVDDKLRKQLVKELEELDKKFDVRPDGTLIEKTARSRTNSGAVNDDK